MRSGYNGMQDTPPHFSVIFLIFVQFLVKNSQHAPPFGQKACPPIQKILDLPLNRFQGPITSLFTLEATWGVSIEEALHANLTFHN